MARYMNTESNVIYRVVVIRRNHLDNPVKTIYGPYDRPSTAGFVKSYMTGATGGWRRDRIIDSYIETSEPTWERHG